MGSHTFARVVPSLPPFPLSSFSRSSLISSLAIIHRSGNSQKYVTESMVAMSGNEEESKRYVFAYTARKGEQKDPHKTTVDVSILASWVVCIQCPEATEIGEVFKRGLCSAADCNDLPFKKLALGVA